jgi:hypothetical protein
MGMHDPVTGDEDRERAGAQQIADCAGRSRPAGAFADLSIGRGGAEWDSVCDFFHNGTGVFRLHIVMQRQFELDPLTVEVFGQLVAGLISQLRGVVAGAEEGGLESHTSQILEERALVEARRQDKFVRGGYS